MEEANEQKEVRQAALFSVLLVSAPWLVQFAAWVFSLRLQQYGLHPLDLRGLAGVLTMPLLHGGWGHLFSNTLALLLLIFGLFLLYKRAAWKILLCLYLFSGFLTWLMGRGGTTHIGASGLVYALAAFHFVSGVIKKEPRQRAFALLVAFLYGGFVWAFFPSLYQGTSISWEGHLSGLLAGISLAFCFRGEGPAPPVYQFLEEEDDDDDDDEYDDDVYDDDYYYEYDDGDGVFWDGEEACWEDPPGESAMRKKRKKHARRR